MNKISYNSNFSLFNFKVFLITNSLIINLLKELYVWFIYSVVYQPLTGYLIQEFDENIFYTVIYLQVFLSNTNNSYTVIWLQVTVPI